ncbi:hypothetical protein OROMI_031315 [Orobanche minor]
MAVTKNSDGSSKRGSVSKHHTSSRFELSKDKVDERIQPPCGKSAVAGPCDPSRCSDKGPSNVNQGRNRGVVTSYKPSKKQKRVNPDSLSDIEDAEVVGYLNTKEEINYKRILWEALNREYTEAKKQKQTTETKNGVSVEKAAKTIEKVESHVMHSPVNKHKNQGSATAQMVGGGSSHVHRYENSPCEKISHSGSGECSYNEDQHDISYDIDNETYGALGGDYEYEDEHLDDEYYDF